MNKIIVNGITYHGDGDLVINNGQIIIGGKNVTPESKIIHVVVNGNINNLKVDACKSVEVSGDADMIKTQSGDVIVKGNVKDSISTMSGDVSCGNVGGDIKTMSGDVKYKKS